MTPAERARLAEALTLRSRTQARGHLERLTTTETT
jgi:hypothetical protein